MKKEKVFKKSSEFTRPDAIGVILKKYGKDYPKAKVIALADKLYISETNKGTNLRETETILNLIVRFLRTYEPTVKPEPKAKTDAKTDAKNE